MKSGGLLKYNLVYLNSMNTDIELLKQKLAKLPQTANERSYYPILCEFIQNYASKTILNGVMAISEESLTVDDKNIGFPDITIRRQNGHLIGWWEVKLPDDSLAKESFREQFTKYKDSLENILITNLREWQVWQWDDDGKPQKVSEVLFDVSNFAIGEDKKLENLLTNFFEGKPYEAKTPKQLALALAKKALLLSKQVEESFNEQDGNSDLAMLKQTFEKTLIQDISTHQFANMIAETMAYSLFLAFLEHIHRGKEEEITLTSAIDYLPTNVPILADLYSLVRQVSKGNAKIQDATQLLIDQLKVSQMNRIYHKLVEHKPGEDPVIQFYEPFLKEYDPKEREARGVYYTPKPVVDFIIRSVDIILKEKFGKEKGLANESVQVLDPATGTGTFLMSAIQEIYTGIRKENIILGSEMVQKEFNKIVINHILKHFFAFELLVAPYAIAHLKLTLLLEEFGFNFVSTKSDSDDDNDRLKIYLANTLDDPNAKGDQGQAGGNFESIAFPSIPVESEKARRIKNDAPIIAIVGNPPYSSVSTNIGKWVKELVNDYLYIDGIRIEEKSKRNNLQNDYVKFIRFAQWKLSQAEKGVIGFITDNSYLDGKTFRGMRKNLLDIFSEIFILNLHGDSKRKEKSPEGLADKNVFDITQGVAIVFLIKNESNKTEKGIYYFDLLASKKDIKFDWLNSHNFTDITKKLLPKTPNYYFIPIDTLMEEEWNSFISIKDIFSAYGTGIKTNRDGFVVDFDANQLLARMSDFYNNDISDEDVAQKYNLKENYVWKVSKARSKFKSSPISNNKVISFNYRPFDTRKLYFDDAVVFNPRKVVTTQFFNKNLGFMTSNQISTGSFHHTFVSSLPLDICSLSLQTREAVVCAPLYIYSSSTQRSLLDELIIRKHNLSSKIIDKIQDQLKLDFLFDGQGDLQKTFGPEDVFYYAYAVFHSPTYRNRYTEQLKIDFPHLPLTDDKGLFAKLVSFGRELVNLHLLGENPFDSSKTILNESDKWNIKIGGQKQVDLEDWKITDTRYDDVNKRVYVNSTQYFEGIDKQVWDFMIGGYKACESWLKYRKKAQRSLSTEDLKHFMKIIVSLRETIRIMREIDQAIPEWPLK